MNTETPAEPVSEPAASPSDAGRKTLLLVDGSSYLYRAFHAMPDLRAVPGDPTSPATGAIRGMINMMQSLRKDVRADYVACVFDAKGPTFRDDWYPQYKANRAPMPDDLRAQIPPIHDVVRILGWKVLDVPGEPIEIRCAWGGTHDYCFTTTALTSKIWLLEADAKGHWSSTAVADIGDASKIPLPVDISISADYKLLWVNTWNDCTSRLFDITEPHNPQEI